VSERYQGNALRTLQLNRWMLPLVLALSACGGGDGAVSTNCSLSSAAGCGGTPQPVTPAPVPPPVLVPLPPPDPALRAAAVSLVFSSNELGSAGLAGAEVTVNALVKTAANVALAGAKVEFAADSGILSGASASTDASGKASAVLATGGSMLNRPINVSVTVGSQSATGVVTVVGTRLTLSGPELVVAGSSLEQVATLVDSAGRPIVGASISAVTANGNPVTPATSTSDSAGAVRLHLSANTRGAERLTVSALGASLAKTITIGGSDVTLTPAVSQDASGAEVLAQVPVGSCSPVDGAWLIAGVGQRGDVTLGTSRGILYRDAACGVALTGSLGLVAGAFPRTYIRSANAGVSSINASIAYGPSGGTRLEFVAPLLVTATVNLQPELAVLGGGERSVLIAVVRDGSPANNLVKGATVQFSVLSDPSGGALQAPYTAVTGSDGVARGTFVAGPADGGKNGTVLQARVVEQPWVTSTAALTVNKKALSIQFGTGNTLLEYSSAILQQDFAVFVSDSAGNPVPNVAVSVAAWPTFYRKGAYGWYLYNGVDGIWRVATPNFVCANEDVQRKGLYERAYDLNGNGLLDPGIPLSVTISGKTDATGLATASLRYPRDRGNWVKVELSVNAVVAGTETLARNSFWLPVLAKDMTDITIPPPGLISPYGVNDCRFPD
jgi:hypothetical protein